MALAMRESILSAKEDANRAATEKAELDYAIALSKGIFLHSCLFE